MAHSLELRVPLLDNRLVDLMVPVPWQLKYRQGTHGKLVLRKAIREILPEETLRKPKWGFSVNVYSWYKGELGEIIRQVVPESDIISKYFSQSLIRNLIAKPLSPDNRRSYVLLWQLLGFHLWHRMFVDSDELARPKLDLEYLLA
jgi:asparagine synthase (glutamine-hydrolysing)